MAKKMSGKEALAKLIANGWMKAEHNGIIWLQWGPDRQVWPFRDEQTLTSKDLEWIQGWAGMTL